MMHDVVLLLHTITSMGGHRCYCMLTIIMDLHVQLQLANSKQQHMSYKTSKDKCERILDNSSFFKEKWDVLTNVTAYRVVCK